MLSSELTRPISLMAMRGVSSRSSASARSTYLSKKLCSTSASALRRFLRYPCAIGRQPRSLDEMKMTPARETVAGEALRRSSTSICSVTLGRSIGMRSLFASVRILLSSMTVLRFSIQMASTGPSSTSHVKFFLSLFARRHSCAKMPSVHSLATTSIAPNICGEVIALGFMVTILCGWPIMGATIASGGTTMPCSALCSTSMMVVLPVPLGPTHMSEWRTRHIS